MSGSWNPSTVNTISDLPDLEPWFDDPTDQWDELPSAPEFPYDE